VGVQHPTSVPGTVLVPSTTSIEFCNERLAMITSYCFLFSLSLDTVNQALVLWSSIFNPPLLDKRIFS
jgi:hypothetical protein